MKMMFRLNRKHHIFFSECELTFAMYAVAHPSVVCRPSVVDNVRAPDLAG